MKHYFSKFKSLKSIKYKRGFTLVELMVSTTLYATVSIVLISILLLLSNLNMRLQNDMYALNDMALAVESMQRDIKMGTNYRCDDGTTMPSAFSQFSNGTYKIISQDCAFDETQASTYNGGNVRLVFKAQTGEFVSYRLINNHIVRTVYNMVGNFGVDTDVTDNEIRIDSLRFYIEGTSQIDGRQTSITTTLKGTNIKNDMRGYLENKEFKQQYTVTPRSIDG